jgi:hypothetical protein
VCAFFGFLVDKKRPKFWISHTKEEGDWWKPVHETKKEKTTTQNKTPPPHLSMFFFWWGGGDLKANRDKKNTTEVKNHVKCVVSARGYADACGVMVIVHDTTKSSALNAV